MRFTCFVCCDCFDFCIFSQSSIYCWSCFTYSFSFCDCKVLFWLYLSLDLLIARAKFFCRSTWLRPKFSMPFISNFRISSFLMKFCSSWLKKVFLFWTIKVIFWEQVCDLTMSSYWLLLIRIVVSCTVCLYILNIDFNCFINIINPSMFSCLSRMYSMVTSSPSFPIRRVIGSSLTYSLVHSSNLHCIIIDIISISLRSNGLSSITNSLIKYDHSTPFEFSMISKFLDW